MSKTFSLHARDYLDTPDRKRFFNEALFTEVPPRYDLITRLLSFGRDAAWKRDMIAALPDMAPRHALDLACGTGDLTAAVHRRYPEARVTGIDLTPAMIDRAAARHGPSCGFQVGDMGALAFPDASMDLVTGGYALRNAPDLDVALGEVARVLVPGGHAAFLDFSKRPCRLHQAMTHAALAFWGGLWGLILHRHANVYGYIADSLARYPDCRRLRVMAAVHGLIPVVSASCMGGMIEWIVFRKQR